MSVNMADGVTDSDNDYSDFEYQQVGLEVTIANPGEDDGSSNKLYNVQVDPIDDIGGLKNNEVAELVGFKLQAYLEAEGETGNQGLPADLEVRGIFGINLNQEGGHFRLSNREQQGESQQVDTTSEDRILHMYTARSTVGFQDQGIDFNGGLGGGGSNEMDRQEQYFRQTHGRGPVLDQNDSISWSGNVVGSDLNIEVKGVIRTELIWDVAEVSDAGRAFSVPM